MTLHELGTGKEMPDDPGVWERDGKWYCYDLQCGEEGPYDTKEEAEEAKSRNITEYFRIHDEANKEQS